MNDKEAPQESSQIPNFYIKKPVEGLVLRSADQLVVSASAELKAAFRRDFEVPNPPDDLFATLQNFAERGIKGFDEVYYQPRLQLTENDEFWKGRGIVKPEPYFWQQIKNGDFRQEAAMLEEGWYIGDRRGKPMYAYRQQRYGEDDYIEPLMTYLRATNRIQKYSILPDYSRFGASPQEIEGVILPEFAERSEARGGVRNRRYMEFNVRGNIAHPEYGQTNTWEWFGDSAFRGSRRLFGGLSGRGGLALVFDDSVDGRDTGTGFSPVVFFPSKPR